MGLVRVPFINRIPVSVVNEAIVLLNSSTAPWAGD